MINDVLLGENIQTGGMSSGAIGFIVIVLVCGYAVYLSVTKNKTSDTVVPRPNFTASGVEIPPTKVFTAGWYPTPDAQQDRYHDGTDWTEEYRDHIEPLRAYEEPIVEVVSTESIVVDSDGEADVVDVEKSIEVTKKEKRRKSNKKRKTSTTSSKPEDKK